MKGSNRGAQGPLEQQQEVRESAADSWGFFDKMVSRSKKQSWKISAIILRIIIIYNLLSISLLNTNTL